MTPLWTPNVLHEVPELSAQRRENFIFIFNGLYNLVSALVLTLPYRILNIPSKKGISSSRVRSGPSARAIVESLWIAFKRSKTSSCYIHVLIFCPASPSIGLYKDVVSTYLQLVNEHSYWVELLRLIYAFGHAEKLLKIYCAKLKTPLVELEAAV